MGNEESRSEQERPPSEIPDQTLPRKIGERGNLSAVEFYSRGEPLCGFSVPMVRG